MIHIKNTLKIKLISSLILAIFISCGDDSSDDMKIPDDTGVEEVIDEIPEEVVIEDFANFKNDPKLIEYVEQSINALDREVDLETASLFEEIDELSDQENEELAIALGFEGTVQMNEYYDLRIESWDQLVKRFDLRNQNEVEINEILVDLFMEQVEKVVNRDPEGQNIVKGPMDWWCTPCYIPYSQRYRERRDTFHAMQKVCWDQRQEDGDLENFRKCQSRAVRINEIKLFRNHFDVICCYYSLCNIVLNSYVYEICEVPST
ncbi:hypothetical protein [Aquimarina mytili]|uniref:Uncharacterized protein n=1 Tax=Aquimarina mytili TaxID=874423 RepID=A0A937D9K2_9FLAO|nr:hypothetical protein [Aquimarina mytili]MBL0682588.1 hypothetical protein [Aquimarina mytili]